MRVPLLLLLAACSQGDAVPWREVPGGDARRGAAAVERYGCGACHVIPGVRRANGHVGPPLTDYARRHYIAGAVPNEAANLVLWIQNPQVIEPGTLMPTLGVSDRDARDIAAYLYTLGRDALGPPHLLDERVLHGR
jgi:cytochrome c1